MNSKLLQHHKILFCQFNICFCFHVTCFHHFLALQLTTILHKRQLTRDYLYDNPTTTNLYLWRPSFQFVRFLWVFFFCLFFASLKKIHWDCRRLIVLMALTLARSRLLRCSWKAAGLFSAAWRGRGNRRRNKKPRLMQFRPIVKEVVMLLSASKNVRTCTATVKDRLKAEVASGREGQECYSKPHTLMTTQ